ncbi:MAG: hypothetical protein U5Q03_18075 [Bacteroidota bacterium]|nr:hypothetical protein [Bacteroidota bacterium]
MFQNTQNDQVRKPGFGPDTFSLYLNYQDPFLKKTSHSKIPPKSLLKKPKLKMQESLKWPNIQYFGLVKSRINGEVAVNLEIDNISYIVKDRSDCKGISLRKITPDSVISYWSGEQKTIYRN